METPFVFGKLALQDEFTNREKELAELANSFLSGINTIIISPRRWGKSSLVSRAVQKSKHKNKKILFCCIDMFNIRNEEQFYQVLTTELIKISATKWEERISNTKKFIARFIPKISYSADLNTDFSIGLDWREVKKDPDQILDLSEKIAKSKDVKIVVCIDEFQNISEFENPLAFQKKLRSHWQKHQLTSYCLYGSKRHMMMDVFASSSMPFYKFGNLMFLNKIDEPHWIKFIVKRFADTGKKITPENAALISQYANCHPYYVQQLAQQSWLHATKVCSKAIVDIALENLIMQLSLLFQNITDSLSTTQINFLRAVLDDATKLSSKENLHTYRFGTSANVLRIKDALINKEIIDSENNKYYMLDPMYEHWLRNIYFKGFV